LPYLSFIPVLPFSKVQKTLQKPLKVNDRGTVETVGDHLRLKRLQLGLFQKDVAALIGVSEDTVTYWERNRTVPLIRYMPNIIAFLGYNPIPIDTSTIGGRIYEFRILNGLTHKTMGKLVGVDASTIGSWEQHLNKPGKRVKTRLMQLLKSK
jgi:DNA-binding XRE family transcriptional regulator